MNGSNSYMAYPVVSVIFKPESEDTELNRIMWNLLGMNYQTGLKSLYVQSIIEGRAAYTVSPGEGFTPVSIWMTYP